MDANRLAAARDMLEHAATRANAGLPIPERYWAYWDDVDDEAVKRAVQGLRSKRGTGELNAGRSAAVTRSIQATSRELNVSQRDNVWNDLHHVQHDALVRDLAAERINPAIVDHYVPRDASLDLQDYALRILAAPNGRVRVAIENARDRQLARHASKAKRQSETAKRQRKAKADLQAERDARADALAAKRQKAADALAAKRAAAKHAQQVDGGQTWTG